MALMRVHRLMVVYRCVSGIGSDPSAWICYQCRGGMVKGQVTCLKSGLSWADLALMPSNIELSILVNSSVA